MRYLLDTNIIAEPTKVNPNQQVLNCLNQFAEEVAISSVSWHELWFGIERLPLSRKRQYLEEYLESLLSVNLPILPYNADASRWFATERARLTQMGLAPSYPDGQIAAISKANNLILVTRNVSDYANFEGLIIENWFN
uniref:Type II toxin-antitoxin system VapC family toxin n=1 Tax=Oscillatoriales cyanobacterium SpSt-402 TaxID=2282168 RepID=A0A832M2U5_9CYAN